MRQLDCLIGWLYRAISLVLFIYRVVNYYRSSALYIYNNRSPY